MTITATKVRTQIAAASTMLDALGHRLPTATTNATLAALDPKSRTDRPVAEDAGIRSIGEHTDPTARQALAAIAYHERVLELFEANLDTLKACLVNLVSFADEWCPKATDHPRCNAGRDSVQPWARPDCTELVGFSTRDNGTVSLRADGLCDSCRMRKYRHDKAMEVA